MFGKHWSRLWTRGGQLFLFRGPHREQIRHTWASISTIRLKLSFKLYSALSYLFKCFFSKKKHYYSLPIKMFKSDSKIIFLLRSSKSLICRFKQPFFGMPHLSTYIFFLFMNEPRLGTEIDPGVALTPFSSCTERDKFRTLVWFATHKTDSRHRFR